MHFVFVSQHAYGMVELIRFVCEQEKRERSSDVHAAGRRARQQRFQDLQWIDGGV